MKTWRLVALVLAVLLIGTFGMAGAAATGHSGGKASFTLVAVSETADEVIERGFTFTDRVETMHGEEIGWDGGRCINLVADVDALDKWMCELVFHLPEGNIATAGPFDLAGVIAGEADVVFAVTGGTGDFLNVRGEVEVVPDEDDPTRAFVFFRLRGASAKY